LLSLIPISAAALFWNAMEIEREHFNDAPDPLQNRRIRWMAISIAGAALPVNVLLALGVFIVFPRLTLNASLPGFIGHRAGYTDQVNLDQKGTLQDDSSVVLWLAFPYSKDRSLWDGYLRGDTLNRFNGHRWAVDPKERKRLLSPDSNNIFTLRVPRPASPLLRQSITLADTSAATLFTASRAARITAPLPMLQMSEGGSVHWLVPWRRPLHYDVVSEPFADMDHRSADVELPGTSLNRIRALTEQIAGSGPPAAQAENIERYLKTTYRYSPRYGDQVSPDPIDNFLFVRREGLCGHFASAMAVMLRLRHIPSRVVAGYIKGEWNEPANCIVIRQRDAHAWVEAYLPHEGWVPFDPSPRQGESETRHRSLLVRVGQYWDYFNLQWNRFVIQYDLYSQIKAFENLKGTTDRFGSFLAHGWTTVGRYMKHPSTDSSAGSFHGGLSAFQIYWKRILFFLLILVSGIRLLGGKMLSSNSAWAFYLRFLRDMSRNGIPKHSWETGMEYADRLKREKPDALAVSRQVTQKYYDLRYRKDPYENR